MINALQNRLKYLKFLQNIGYEYCDSFTITQTNTRIFGNSLEELKENVLNCHLCNISKNRQNVVFGEGDTKANLLIVGEAPGAKEDELGRPFVGRAGELLTAMIEKGLQISRQDVYIANIIKCRPPNNRNPEPQEVENCIGYLEKQIDLINPKVILSLGNVSFQNLTGLSIGITKARGRWYQYKNIPLLASYHPSYLLRNPSAKKEAYADLLKVKEVLMYS